LSNGTGGSAGLASNYTLTGGTDAVNVGTLTITVAGTANNKIYDGNTSATVATLGSSGVISGDTVTFADTSATFNTKNVLTATTVTIAGISDAGADAVNYTLSNTSTTAAARITPLGITVSGTGTNKVYDAGVNDVVSLTSGGVISGDVVSFADTSATFADKNVGNAKPVSIAGITATGTDAGNYTLNNVTASTAANITPLGITVTGTGTNKVYDADVNDVVTLASGGVITGDAVTFADTSATFADKNVGNAKPVSIAGITASGTDAGNYTLNNVTASTAANITPLGITVTGTGTNKVYDAGVNDVVSLASGGVISGDVVTFADTSATFADKNVGTGKTVSIAGITASGTDSGNYTLNNATASTAANITPLGITVTGTGANKVYDAGVNDVVTLASGGVISGDAVTFADTSATFADKNVGTGKTVSIAGITASGTDAGNYTLNNATASTAANITPAIVNLTGSRTYDALLDAPADIFGTAGTVNGVAGENLLLAGNGTLAAKDVVTSGAMASINGLTLVNGTGSSAGLASNYQLTGGSDVVTVTPLAITVAGVANSKTYDGTTVATLSTLGSGGVLPGDNVRFSDIAATFSNKNVGNDKTVSITGITATGTDAADYSVNTSAVTTADVTPATLTETAIPVSIAAGQAPKLNGSVSGFVPGDTLANATGGTLVWATPAKAGAIPGTYAIDGSGLTAENYVFVQSPVNAAALTITAAPDATASLSGSFGIYLAPADIATPYGVGSANEYGNNTGNARRDTNPTHGNRHLSDFTGRLALTVIDVGIKMPPEAQ
jgi:hypothetical protein